MEIVIFFHWLVLLMPRFAALRFAGSVENLYPARCQNSIPVEVQVVCGDNSKSKVVLGTVIGILDVLSLVCVFGAKLRGIAICRLCRKSLSC